MSDACPTVSDSGVLMARPPVCAETEVGGDQHDHAQQWQRWHTDGSSVCIPIHAVPNATYRGAFCPDVIAAVHRIIATGGRFTGGCMQVGIDQQLAAAAAAAGT